MEIWAHTKKKCFKVECIQQCPSHFSAPCALSLALSAVLVQCGVTVERLLMLELSFLESYCSGRKALWSSYRDMLARAESDENFELIHSRKVLKLTPNAQL